MELPLATQTYHNGFGEELAMFTNKIKSLVQHAQEKVDLKLEKINKAIADFIKLAATIKSIQALSPNNAYSQALIKGQFTFSQSNIATNPRMLARHSIRARQTMLEGLDKDSKISTIRNREEKDAINKILLKLELEGSVRIQSAIKQHKRGLLIGFDTDYGAAWIRVKDN
ncbi:hypothetical protein JR316_0002243 [Psilocybe cubensis]|uniref:Uncharacterized protein n=1 Tax=Psilocybe cubensis TaxID=181762 RepID=A0ACB8HBF2_PSICU|nr:hypothetical protein JR316_0002243 [Psilocybe cubensis]KAH9485335.1 hypothetical protein JR316_0002243 [Psilocybe cubensis]